MSDSRSTPADPLPPRGLGASTSGPPTTPGPASSSGKPGKSGKSGKSAASSRPNDPLRRSRTSGLWVATIGAGLLLILLIIFIVQNTQSVQVDFLGWTGTPPLSVALLVATAAGILVTGLVGSLRIFQLRRRVKRAER